METSTHGPAASPVGASAAPSPDGSDSRTAFTGHFRSMDGPGGATTPHLRTSPRTGYSCRRTVLLRCARATYAPLLRNVCSRAQHNTVTADATRPGRPASSARPRRPGGRAGPARRRGRRGGVGPGVSPAYGAHDGAGAGRYDEGGARGRPDGV